MARHDTTTIILTHCPGRFANQLTLFGHLIGLVEEHPWLRLVNMSFWKHADLCGGTESNQLCRYPNGVGQRRPRVEMFPRILRRVRAVLPRQVVRGVDYGMPRVIHRCWGSRVSRQEVAHLEEAIGTDSFLEKFRGRKSVALCGWFMRDWDLFTNHQQAVREFLKPASRFQSTASTFMTDVRRRHKPVIGLLMRQSDYRTWVQGRYFLSTPQYRTYVEQLQLRFGPDCAFVVATDEEQDPDAFKGLNAYWCTGQKAGPGHHLESLVELSLCDVIVTVPSTFSLWAAFFGEVPVLPIAPGAEDLTETELVEGHLVGAHHHPVLNRCTR